MASRFVCQPSDVAKKRLTRKACDRASPPPLFRTTSPYPHITSAKMSAPTAMCSIETVNGREYKVKDMAMADFGYVRTSDASGKKIDRVRRFRARRRWHLCPPCDSFLESIGPVSFASNTLRNDTTLSRVFRQTTQQPSPLPVPFLTIRRVPKTLHTVASRSSSRKSRCPASCP